MVRETQFSYERLTVTTIELNWLFANFTAVQPNTQSVSSNGSVNHLNVSMSTDYMDSLSGTLVNKSVIRNHTASFNYEIRDPLWIVIPISIIYSTIFVIGVLGNVITCVVIARNKSMHTATNYYLFSLAVSDLLLLLSGVPQEIYFIWFRYPYPFDNNVCILQGFAAETSANATVLTITAFTVERYVAICKPFLSHTMSKLSRAVRYILAIWVIAMCLAVPQALALQIDEEFSTCTVRRDQQQHVFTISTVIVFMFPMCVLTILYVLIGLQLRRSKVMKRGTQRGSSVRLKHSIFKKGSHRTIVTVNSQNDSPQHYSESMLTSSMQQQPLQAQQSLPLNISTGRKNAGNLSDNTINYERNVSNNVHLLVEQTNSLSSEDGRINYSNRAQYHSTKHVVKMLVAVVIAFFLCWAPFHAQRLFAVYGNDQNHNESIRVAYEILTYISGVLYFISTCINPVLYNIMSHKFREAFKETLANYIYRRSGHPLRQRMFFRNVSLRSNSNNSHSMNTCSTVCCTSYPSQQSCAVNETTTISTPFDACSNPHQLRYLETDMARLKRPLVVSFRKMPNSKATMGNTPRQNETHGCNIRRQFFHSNDFHTTNQPTNTFPKLDADTSVSHHKHCCLRKLTNYNKTHWCEKAVTYNIDLRNENVSSHTRTTRQSWLPPKNVSRYPLDSSKTHFNECSCRQFFNTFQHSNRFNDEHAIATTISDQLQYKYDIYPHLRNMYLSSNPVLNNSTSGNLETAGKNHSKISKDKHKRKQLETSPYASPQLSKPCKRFEEKLNRLLSGVNLEFSDESSNCSPAVKKRKAFERFHSKDSHPMQIHKASIRKSQSLP